MQKTKRLAPAQYLIVLALLALAAYLRLQGSGSPSPSQAGQTPGSPTQSPVEPTQVSPNPIVASPRPALLASQMSSFDYFVLALSWSPDYCATNGNSDPQQCSLGKKLGFVLHGLWPQNEKGYPSNCSTEKMPASIKDQFAGLYPNEALFDHEWEKHGTCTGLAPVEYLQLGKQLKTSVVIPGEFRSPEQPFRTSRDQLKALFMHANPGFGVDAFEVSCSGSGIYLKEIYVCFSREGEPTPCSVEMQKTAQKSCQAADFLVRKTR